MKRKKDVVTFLFSDSLDKANEELNLIAEKGKALIEVIKEEVFSKIEFPSTELFQRAVDFNERHNVNRLIGENYSSSDDKNSARRRRYNSLLRLKRFLNCFALLAATKGSCVIIPFRSEGPFESPLCLDQKGLVWKPTTDRDQLPVLKAYSAANDETGPYYFYRAYIGAYRQNFISTFSEAMKCKPARIEKDLDLLERFYGK